MEVRIEWEKGRKHAFCAPTKSSDENLATTINVHDDVHAHVELPTCDKNSEEKKRTTFEPAT